MITKDARCTRETKSRTALAETVFNKKKPLFTSKLDLNLRKKLVKCYIWCYYIQSRGIIKSYIQ